LSSISAISSALGSWSSFWVSSRDGPGLVHDGPFDRLANPPGRVGRKAKTAFRVELLHRPDQTEVTLFDQVEQRQSAVDVAPGDLHHQAQVAFDHATPTVFITLAS
jgi:hypothetical protein